MAFRASFLSLLLLAATVVVVAPLEGLRAEEKAPEKAPAAKAHTVIEKGSKVSIEYTLTIDGGEVADTNVGKAPLQYEQGGGKMLPAFEAQLAGLTAGATKEFDLTAEQGYGPVRKELFKTVDAAQIPEEARKVGAMLTAQTQNGQQRPVRVSEVNGDKIVLDLNHPLAGKKLHFAVKVLSVE
jgi:FKBP-type peptidyl-prolyl cis-trans isomerase SlyD